MRRSARHVVGALGGAVGLVLGTAAAGLAAGSVHMGAVRATTVTDDGAQAFADVATCAATSDHLLAAIVVDQSGSLQQTDPEDQRVGAITTALDSLGQLAESSGGALDVQVTLAAFGTGYEELVGWGTVDGAHEEALHRAATDELPQRNDDYYTDYRAALRGAQTALTARAGELEGSSCKVVLWFTDGKLDVDGTGSGPRTEAAWQELCAPQGILDGVRGDDVVVLALALFTAEGGGAVTEEDRDRLRAVVEGQGQNATCGTVPVPATASGGAYLAADDAGNARRMFARAAALIAGGNSGPSVQCPDDVCVDGTLRVPADAGVGGFRVVVERAPGLTEPELRAPDGSSIRLEPGTTSIASASVTTGDRDGLLVTDVRFPSGSPGGEWSLVTDPSVASSVDVYYFWGVALTVQAPDGLVVGESRRLLVSARYPDGTPADLAGLRTVDLTTRLSGGVVLETSQMPDGWELTVEVPRSDVPPWIEVDATARATTSPSGILLGPVSVELELATVLPPSFPSVATGRLDLPAISGLGATSGTLRLVGSERGVTSACFDTARVEGPAPAGPIQVGVSPPCVEIPAGGEAEVEVTVTPEAAADGRIDGVLPVALEGVDAGESIVVEVPFGATMSRPVDEATRWGLIAAFTLIALAMAWLTAEIARRLGDRYHLSPHARVASVAVVFDENGIRRADGRPALLDPVDDFQPFNVGAAGRRSTFSAAGLQFGTVFPLFPLAGGHGWVAADDGSVVVGPSGDGQRDDGSRASAPFPGPVGFTVKVDGPVPTEGEIPGRLVVLVDSQDGVVAVLADRLDDVRGAPWDALAGRARAAGEKRAEAAAQAAGGPARRSASAAARAGGPVATPPAPGSDWADASGGPEVAGEPLPSTDWASDDRDHPVGPLPSSSAWMDETPVPIPPAEPAGRRWGRRRQPRRGDPARRRGPDEERDQAGEHDRLDRPPAPPSSTNFWD